MSIVYGWGTEDRCSMPLCGGRGSVVVEEWTFDRLGREHRAYCQEHAPETCHVCGKHVEAILHRGTGFCGISCRAAYRKASL